MNKSQKRELGIAWAFVIIGAILAIFINIFSDSIFSLYTEGFDRKVFGLFVVFGAGSVFLVELFSYVFENFDQVRGDGIHVIVAKYIRSWFRKNN